MMMALMKIARVKSGGGTGDSFVDLAGYAACGGEINHVESLKRKSGRYPWGNDFEIRCDTCRYCKNGILKEPCKSCNPGTEYDNWERSINND